MFRRRTRHELHLGWGNVPSVDQSCATLRISASPWPPPPQRAAAPAPPPRRRSSSASDSAIRAPLMPTGCPSAIRVPVEVDDGAHGRRGRGRDGETTVARAGQAGRPEGGVGAARVHDHDVFEVFRESRATPRTRGTCFPVLGVRAHRVPGPERCRSGSGCGGAWPHRCRRRESSGSPPSGWWWWWCGCGLSRESPAFGKERRQEHSLSLLRIGRGVLRRSVDGAVGDGGGGARLSSRVATGDFDDSEAATAVHNLRGESDGFVRRARPQIRDVDRGGAELRVGG
ncbi:hypothetical protein Rruber_05287 (plasmid) [Rhodococcus ruber]